MKNTDLSTKAPLSGQAVSVMDAKQAQEKLLIVNRALRLLSACNQVLVRASSEQQLLNDVCRLVVERGGYLMAWVGIAEYDEAQSVRPVAQFGHETGYLEKSRITWADTEQGRGITGAAIRTGSTQVNQNFLTNLAMKPWLAAALENGYQSSISLPLQDGAAAFAVLTVYSVEPEAFNAEEAQLLEELSGNLAYGILHLREHCRREQIEKELSESEERYRVLVENAPEAIVVFDVEQNLLVDANVNAERLFECNREELLKRSPLDFYPPVQQDAFLVEKTFKENNERTLEGEQPVFERSVRSAKGRERLCEVRLVRLPSGSRKLIRGSFIDITERRQSEVLAQQFGRLLQSSFNEIYLFDSHSLNFIQTSDGANKNLGYSARELKRLTPLDLKPLFTRERFDWMIAPLRSGKKQRLLFETIHRRKNGTTYPVEIRLQLMPSDPPVFLAIVQDLTERKKHEQELVESTGAYAALKEGTQHLKSILDNLFAYVALLDTDGVIQEVNKASLERSGLRREDMIGQYFHEGPWWSYDSTVKAQLLEAIEAARQGQTRRYDVFVNCGGDFVPIDFQIAPVRDESGRIVGLLPTAVDITERIRAERRTAHNEYLYRGLFENMPSAVAVYAAVDDGEDFIFKDFNRTGELLEKVNRKDIVGKRLTECFPGVKEFGLFAVLQRVWKTGETEHFPVSFYQDDRISGWRDNHVYRLASGEIVAVYEDVTPRMQAEEDLKLSAQLMNSTSDSAFLLDLQGSFIYLNEAAWKSRGYTRDEMMAMNLRELNTPEFASLIAPRMKEIMEKGQGTYESAHYCKDGSIIPVEINSRLIEHGGRKMLLATIRDITERKQVERFRSEVMNQLEKKELAKSRFLAAAGHDLRQPLTAVSLYLDTLRYTEPTDEQNEILQSLSHSMDTFKSLLDALLNISKLDAGVINPEFISISVSELIMWLEGNFAPMAAEMQLDLRLFFPIRENIFVRSDIGLVKSILMNLVSNAIKFTPMGAILISARQRGDEVLFQVWDTGIGIPHEFLKQVFEEFYQIDNPQRDRTSGLGLGLSIVERSLTLLETGIECRSSVGRGSVFGFRLPLDASAVSDAQHDTLVALNEVEVSGLFVSGKRFVIVEDDAMVSHALSNTLMAMGGEVKSFNNADDALRHANIGHADYFIVDYMLGGTLNGLQFLNQLQQKLGKPINAVLVTGDTSALSAKTFAAYDWPVLHKPANISQLLSGLRAQAL